LQRLIEAAKLAHSLGIIVNAGHGIDYKNIEMILEIPHLSELNIGHSIIAESIMTGIYEATKRMMKLMENYKN
jgi:pyridoxine 5-phosphate synthase